MLLALEGRAEAVKRQFREGVVLAHITGAFTGFAKPVPLEPILKKLDAPARPQRAQTEAEILHAWNLWSAAAKAGAQPANP